MADATVAQPPKDFYVYLHRRATTGEIFYVGKGHGDRAWDRDSRNLHWRNTVEKHGFVVEIVLDGLQEWYAFELEIDLIAYYGRADLGYGPLVNWTDGGDGPSNPSPEIREKLRFWKGKSPSTETRQKMSAAQLGRTHSATTKAKMSASGRARPRETFGFRPKVAVVRSDGVVFESTIAAQEWCAANVNPKADKSNIVKCCRGKINFAYGFTWRYAEKETGAEAPVSTTV